MRQQHKEYYEKNKEKMLAKAKQYYEQNKEKIMEWKKQYNVEYMLKNRERINKNRRLRYAKKKQLY